ncbi:progranulin isoform X4 [Microcaecilia unicolor]|uniref:Progranulin isoform X4 n=1 Tax=Microcaecilia unicolor TaxID=1415580 RepID=A0A6P7ZAP2_9AMPH|nr:progranulin isoform X4 [Microcaecilia unicolor]
MWVSSMLWLALAGVVAALRCPGGQVCDDGSRCCELPGAESACCPQGIVRSLPMVKAGSVNEISENLCPTNVSCPSEYSCLRTPAGLYSCCPLSEAVSCGDSRHCCPRDSLCSLDGKFCLQVSGNTEIGAVICPGGELECPEQTTCCLTVDGSWGCCPMPQAVCCEDKEHCCPHDTTCDMVHSKCLSSEGKKPMWSKFPARKRVAWENATADSSRNNKCEDGLTCPDWTTCCQQQSPKFGCCPMQNAVCCADHIHCCPEGTKCDLIRSICVGTDERSQSPLLTKVLALAKKDEDVNCDDTTSCPDGHTCCLQSRGWGCCPYAEAVCCSDKVHCCPKGFTCITEQGICKQSTLSIPWTAKTPAQVRETMSSKDVQCDDEASCADGQTCCKSASGEWACCPLPQAVCCSDHIHCCPTSYTCNTAAGTCEQNALSIPWSAKTLAQVKTTNSKDVKCDDETSCADGQTCCRTAEGEWGCCPLPEAVCCSDHVHCCPKDYTCNTAAETCEQSPVSIPWSAKTPLQGREILINKDVKCDDETSCADGQTCCRAASGEWACCPLLEAVCCSDHVHCCPAGYTCNTSAGSCDKSLLSIPWVSRTQAQVTKPQQSTYVKCDDTASCKDGQTCCKTQSGDWACCHLPNAVCCEDFLHCCPSGYTCNLSAQTCDKQGLMLPWKLDLSVTLLPPTDATERDVKCDDMHYCKSSQTCCKTTTAGGWACCPYNQGVCCKDMRHCCSAGYKCSFRGRRCIKSKVLRWDENFSTEQQQDLL